MNQSFFKHLKHKNTTTTKKTQKHIYHECIKIVNKTLYDDDSVLMIDQDHRKYTVNDHLAQS